jgi:hypothetical protein
VTGHLARLSPLLLACFFATGAFAPQSPPKLNLGDAVVTGFSGTANAQGRKPAPNAAADATFIDPEGASARIIDLKQPAFVWDGRVFAAPKTFDVRAKDVGQVFGIALDDQPAPNIYLSATSAFGLNIVRRGRDGAPERMKKGGPGAGWMKGQFGLDLQGGPGAIYRIDGRSGVATLFANVTLDGVPNPGAGLGNLAFDSAHQQLFVTDLYTGMIYRFDPDGKELGRYDHGVTGLTAAKLAAVPFDPKNRPNIASDRFDAEKPDSWGFAPAARRVFGLAVHDGRLYYSVMSGPQIWSVGIERDGSFAADPRWELDVPAQAGPLPVSDIAFSQKGAMILAQRALIAGAYDYSAFTRPGEPQVFRIWLKGPNDPPSPGRWKPVPEEYAVGFAGSYRNTNGGVALGYGYGQDGRMSSEGCEFSLWTTGQNLRNNPGLRSRLDPGGALVVHGLAGVPSSPVRNFNEPPWTSYAVNYDDTFHDPRAAGHMGSVRIYSKPCASPAAYSGPGYPASAPYLVGTVVTPAACIGRDCPPPPSGTCPPNCPPPANPVDLGIAKIGEVNLGNPNGPYNFTIGVRNLGVAIPSTIPLTFTDVVPAGMTFTNVTSSNWTCAPLPGPPIPAGGTLTCTYSGTFPIAANQALGWVTIVATGGNGPYENCAKLDQPDGDPSNDKACVTVRKDMGNLTVGKEIINNTNPKISTAGLVFPVTVTCGGTVTTLNLIDGLPQTISNIAFNTTCTAVEGTPPLPSGSCPTGQQAAWATPPVYLPPTPVTVITGTSVSIRIQNTLECKPAGRGGEVLVLKTVDYKGPFVKPVQTYPVTVTCGSSVNNMTLVENVTQTAFGNIPYGTSCTVVEPPPPTPPNACLPPTQPLWTTTYTPALPVIINSVTATITVANTLDCVQNGQVGALTVNKVVLNRTQPQIPIGTMQFAISTSCQSGSSPATVTPMPLVNGGSQTVSGLAYGTICTISETPPGPPPSGPVACTQVGYTPNWVTVVPPPVTISGPTATATVQNVLTCMPPDPTISYLMVAKTIQNNTSLSSASLNSIVFPVVETCSGMPTVSLPLTTAGPQLRYNVPVGSVCSVSETLPPPPTTGCTGGLVPTWVDPPTYTPASATVNAGTGATIMITNILNCAQPKSNIVNLKCPPPKVANSSGKDCRCPDGMAERGGKCVERVSCVSPARSNQAGTGCSCPENMQLKGRTCVERERKQPRVTPSDVLRVLPGIGFPGRGGGGGGGGAGGGKGAVR